MLALLASYASAIYLFLLNTFASFWLNRARTPTSENAAELGFGAVNIVEVAKVVNCDIVTSQALGTRKATDLPSKESDMTDHTVYLEEATSAIIRQAFLPSKLAEAMKRYGTVNMADMNDFMNKSANRCSTFSNDDNTSEERLFSDGESIISSAMTSVGDESEPPDSAERSKDKRVNKIERGLLVAVIDVDSGKSAGNTCHQLPYSKDDESTADESEDEEFYSCSEESEESGDSSDQMTRNVASKDSVRREGEVLSLREVESNVRGGNILENAFCAAVNDPEGDSTPLSSIPEKRSRTSCILSDDLSLDNRPECCTQEAHTLEATIIHEEVSVELCGANLEVCLASDGTGKKKSITLSQSQSLPLSLEISEEAEQAVPRIVVQSPSLDDIFHQFTPPPAHPCRDGSDDLTEVLDFMEECELELPNRFLSSEFEDDESDEESSQDDYDINNDEYDSFSQAKIFMEPGSMPPGSLHLLRVSDDGTYITIEPLESEESELRLSPFKSMRKVEMTKPVIPAVVVQTSSRKEMTTQIEIFKPTPVTVAQAPFVEEVLIPTEVHTVGESPSVHPEDVLTCLSRIKAEIVGPIPSIVIQSPSIEDISVISVGTIGTKPEAKVVGSTPAIVGPSPSIEAIIALLDLPETEVIGSTYTDEPTQEVTDTSARSIDVELEVAKSTSTPGTVGPSQSIEAILALLDLPNRGEVGVTESTPLIVSPSSSVEDIRDALAHALCIEPESTDFIAPAIIVQSPSLEEIFAMPARTREEIGLSFDIVYSPSMTDLASILACPENPEVEKIESLPSIAREEGPTRSARIEAEVLQSTPTIVVQSPSMEHIPPRPIRPTRSFGEDVNELLDFMNEHDGELPMFATLDEDEEDEDSDSMESHDSATISTDSLTSLEDEDNDFMNNHKLTTTYGAGMAALASLEDEWKPIFDIINNNFGIPFAKGRVFLDKAVEWFENEPKNSWSEESFSQMSPSSSSEGEIWDILNCYANDGHAVGFGEYGTTATNAKTEGVVAVGEDGKSLVMTMGGENPIDDGPNGPIPWTLFKPRVAPEDYLRVPERRYKRS